MSTREDLYKAILDYRGIINPCKKCSGFGECTYGSTATWRGGIGGQSCTSDVCDKCWGSGNADRPWTNIREVEKRRKNWEESQCLEYLAQRSGANLGRIKNRFLQLSEMCLKESRKRKIPEGESPFWWSMEWDMFAKIFHKFGS